MIELLNTNKQTELFTVLDYLNENEDYDFYFTNDNTRVYITDLHSLKKLLKDSLVCYIYKERGDCKGIIVIWKSIGGDTKRYYVKLNAKTPKIATDLLTIVTWNFNKELFAKLRKDSKFIDTLKYKGFRFIGGRGVQMLLQRKPILYEHKIYSKEEDTKDV